eukprot:scaffold181480_cov32-Attheya_sp.AAC.3
MARYLFPLQPRQYTFRQDCRECHEARAVGHIAITQSVVVVVVSEGAGSDHRVRPGATWRLMEWSFLSSPLLMIRLNGAAAARALFFVALFYVWWELVAHASNSRARNIHRFKLRLPFVIVKLSAVLCIPPAVVHSVG